MDDLNVLQSRVPYTQRTTYNNTMLFNLLGQNTDEFLIFLLNKHPNSQKGEWRKISI